MKRTPLKRISKKQAERNRLFNEAVPVKIGRCEECGKLANLDRHHKIHRSQGGKDTPDNIAYLCRICHMKAHGQVVIDSEPQWNKGGL